MERLQIANQTAVLGDVGRYPAKEFLMNIFRPVWVVLILVAVAISTVAATDPAKHGRSFGVQSATASVQASKNIEIEYADNKFTILANSEQVGEGYFNVLCYFTNTPNNCIISDCKVKDGVKITQSIAVDSLVGDRDRDTLSNVVRFDIFHSETFGKYSLVDSRLFVIRVDP